jgi:ATP-dependent DNA helicase RecG
MAEQQNIEYKSSWHDDYLKWVCGFANAQGGVIYIGKDDNGAVVGVDDFAELIQVLDKVLRTLDHKFLIRNISFEGMNRRETLEYPEPALREMLLNALIHRNYMGAPTQIRVYDSKLFVWNDGGLPVTITLQQLKKLHSSHPRNPVLAEACFRGGFIDSWGSGIMKIVDSCTAAGLPPPEMNETEGGFIVTLYKDWLTAERLEKMGLNARQKDAIAFYQAKKEIVSSEYAARYKISDRTARLDISYLVEKEILVKEGDYRYTKFVFR